jgi:hypothetical protein
MVTVGSPGIEVNPMSEQLRRIARTALASATFVAVISALAAPHKWS